MEIHVLERSIPLDERTKCPICGGFSKLTKDIKTIHEKSDILVGLRTCQTCKHRFIGNVPSQEDLIYMYSVGSSFVYGGTGFVVPEEAGETEDRLVKGLNNLFPLIKKTEKKYDMGKYLEIGLGNGGLFSYFQAQGYECYGVEPGTKHSDGNICATIEEIDSQILFDVIVCQDVLEHIQNPSEYMRVLSSRLKKGGRIYMSFPNKDSLLARVLRTKWSQIRPLGHLHFFSRGSITSLCKQNGLKLIQARPSTYGINLLYFGGVTHYLKQIIKFVFMRDQRIVLAIKN